MSCERWKKNRSKQKNLRSKWNKLNLKRQESFHLLKMTMQENNLELNWKKCNNKMKNYRKNIKGSRKRLRN